MNETKHGAHQHPTSARESIRHEPPYWKRAHKSWVFWLAFILMFTAIAIYVMSDNLSLIPRGEREPPQSDSSRK